jgi:hypothetical protein
MHELTFMIEGELIEWLDKEVSWCDYSRDELIRQELRTTRYTLNDEDVDISVLVNISDNDEFERDRRRPRVENLSQLTVAVGEMREWIDEQAEAANCSPAEVIRRAVRVGFIAQTRLEAERGYDLDIPERGPWDG